MTTIAQEDLIRSVADALQFISYYHPPDYIRALGRAYEREQSPAAKDAIAQILTNSRMCAEGRRPICQDTGIVNVFVKLGMEVRFDFQDFEEAINEGVRRAYEREQSPAAKDAIAQILTNSRMCAEGHRPICQDTGIVTVFLKIGMDVRWEDAIMGVEIGRAHV